MSKGRRITRKKLMKVLTQTFDEGGYELTVRSYNLILTRLGFRLGNYYRTNEQAPTRPATAARKK